MPTCTRSPLSRPTASRLFPRPAFRSRRRQPSQRSGRTPAKPTDADAAVTDTTELTLTLTLTPTLTLTLTLTLTNPYQVIDEQAVEARKKKRLDEIKKGTWQGWGKK